MKEVLSTPETPFEEEETNHNKIPANQTPEVKKSTETYWEAAAKKYIDNTISGQHLDTTVRDTIRISRDGWKPTGKAQDATPNEIAEAIRRSKSNM